MTWKNSESAHLSRMQHGSAADGIRACRRQRARHAPAAAIVAALLLAAGACASQTPTGTNGDAVGARDLAGQSSQRFTRDDIVAMADACNERLAPARPFSVEDRQPEPAGEHPPLTVAVVIAPAAADAGDGAESVETAPEFVCMADALGMGDDTRTDLAASIRRQDSDAAEPLQWNDLGFRGWHETDGSAHLTVTWYDPAATNQ